MPGFSYRKVLFCYNLTNFKILVKDTDMADVAEKVLAELREKVQLMNNDVLVMKDGENDAIELDPQNPVHKEWYESR